MVMVSPTLRMVRFQPRRSRMDGELVSAFQISSPPPGFFTEMRIIPCGLRNWNSSTTPVTLTVLLSSKNTANEWCAKAGTAVTTTSASSNTAK